MYPLEYLFPEESVLQQLSDIWQKTHEPYKDTHNEVCVYVCIYMLAMCVYFSLLNKNK